MDHAPDIADADWRPAIADRRRPLYLAIADALAADLQSGKVRPGQRLPAQRALAQALDVDLTTVTRAYGEAQARGLIEARVGQGTFVRALTEIPARAPDLSMNLPPLFDDPALARRLWREAAEIEGTGGLPLLLGYVDAGGAEDDKVAAVRWLQPRNPGLTAQRIVVAGGAQTALHAIFTLLCRPGDRVAAEALCFPGFRALARQLGLQVEPVAMDGEGLVPDAFEALCRAGPPKALYCTPTLHNPTVATLPQARRAAIVAIARRHGVPIVEDDAYGPLKPDGPPPLAALAPELTYHVGGLAKVMSPALRIAYVAAPTPREAQRVAAVQRAAIGMASPLTAMIATRWIETGTAHVLLEAIRSETRARFESVRRRLPRRAWRGDRDAFHVWLSFPEGWTRGLFAARLQAQGVVVTPSDAFAVAGPPPEAARLSVGAFPTRAALDAALDRIADLLAQDPAWDLPTV